MDLGVAADCAALAAELAVLGKNAENLSCKPRLSSLLIGLPVRVILRVDFIVCLALAYSLITSTANKSLDINLHFVRSSLHFGESV